MPAAGSGQRMGTGHPKQYLSVAGRTLLEHTLQRLAEHPEIDAVIPVVRTDEPDWCEVRSRLATLSGLRAAVEGGEHRQDSVANGLAALGVCAETDLVLIHDAARPCLRSQDVSAVIAAARNGVGAILGVPVTDTLKQVDEHGQIQRTIDRSTLWRAQTPQVFAYGPLRHALARLRGRAVPATDEALIMEEAGYSIQVIPGHEDNLKVTHPSDLNWVQSILEGADADRSRF